MLTITKKSLKSTYLPTLKQDKNKISFERLIAKNIQSSNQQILFISFLGAMKYYTFLKLS